MLPSRGLQPARRAPRALAQPVYSRVGTSRQLSSIRRGAGISPLSSPVSPLRRTHASRLDASAVRYASWYAPWTWGRSKTPTEPTEVSPTSSVTKQAPEPLPETVAQTQVPPALKPEVIASQDASNVPEVHRTIESLLENEIPQVPVAMEKAIEKIGDLKAMGLDYGYGPTSLVQWALEHLYIDAGLQWGGAIIAVTLCIRTFMFPFQLNASQNMAKLAAVTPLTKDAQADLQAALKAGDTEKVNAARKKQRRIYEQFDIKPVKSLIPLVGQGIIGFGAFRCLRGMAYLPVPGMSEGGFLWLKDLTVSDPYYIVPAITGGIMYWVVKRGGESGVADSARAEGAQQFMRLFIPAMVTTFTLWMPGATQLYMLCTGILSAITATLLRSPEFRKMCKLAPIPSKEAQKLWTMVAQGQVPLEKVVTRDGKFLPVTNELKMKYLAPAETRNGNTIREDIKLKNPAQIPAHLRGAQAPKVPEALRDRDDDYDSPPSGIANKLDWVRRNYKPSYVIKRSKNWMAQVSGNQSVAASLDDSKKAIAKRKAEEYEFRRRQRLNRN